MWGQRQERVGERKVETKEGSADFRCYFRVSPRNACNEFPYITIRTAPLFTSLLSVPCTGFHIINLESSGISLNASVSPVFPSCQLLSLDKEITPLVCRGMQSGFELSKRIDRTSTNRILSLFVHSWCEISLESVLLSSAARTPPFRRKKAKRKGGIVTLNNGSTYGNDRWKKHRSINHRQAYHGFTLGNGMNNLRKIESSGKNRVSIRSSNGQ